MFIKDMFVKDIQRNIKDVVKVFGDESNEFVEIDEYVVTKEIFECLKSFVRSYKNTFLNSSDEIGFWISGFFGSGKSHFLKILYYILKNFYVLSLIKNNECLNCLIEDFEFLNSIDKEVVLFNIDSKNRKDDSMLDIFVNEFNSLRGFSKNYGFICEIEEQLLKDCVFEKFKNYFFEICGLEWEFAREEFYFHKECLFKALGFVKGFNDLKAEKYFLDAQKNYKMNIEKFGNKVCDYVKSKGDNFTLTFMVDEVSQFISDDLNKILNLQTIVEELSVKCSGKVFVVVTSHVDITSIVVNKKYDFSKIQGRFKTKLNLSSVNVDEVLYKRLLLKNDGYKSVILKMYYNKKFFLKNILDFDIISDFEFSKMSEYEFVSAYPFFPYQLALLRDSIQFMIKNNVISEDFSGGERSFINFFQRVLIDIKDCEINRVVPFYMFYNSVSDFINYNHQYIFSILNENKNLTEFDLNVMKTLFLIKYILSVVPTINTISSLMICDINSNADMKIQVSDSLLRLVSEGFVNNDGDKFYFLCKVERDINSKILKINVDSHNIKQFLCDEIFNNVLKFSKVKYNNKIYFSFNQHLDEINYRVSSKNLIGVKILTTNYNENFDVESLRVLSSVENNVIVYLNYDKILINEVNLYLKLEKFLRYNTSNLKSEFLEILNFKQEELKNRFERIKILINNSIKNSFVFVNGEKITSNFLNVDDILKNAITRLIFCRFNKFNYINKFVDSSKKFVEISLNEIELNEISKTNHLFVNELLDFINKFESLKFSELVVHFKNIPYGFSKYDVLLALVHLIKLKKVSSNCEVHEIINGFSQKNFLEKFKIFRVNEVSVKDFSLCKRILGEVFNKKYLLNNFNEFYLECIEDFKNLNLKLLEVKELAFENEKYPSKNLIKSIDDFLNRIFGSSQREFIDLVKGNEDFLNSFEDFEVVCNFYKSVQFNIFKDGIILSELYVKDKNFIEDGEILKIYNEIKTILESDYPYNKISKLKILINRFWELHKKILNEAILNVNSFIDDEILKNLNLDLVVELKNKLASSISLFDVYGIKMESIFLKNKILN